MGKPRAQSVPQLPPCLVCPDQGNGREPRPLNGFLAAGLIWSLFINDPDWAARIATFCLLCVTIAGAYGAATVSRRILYAQTVPALLTLAAVWTL